MTSDTSSPSAAPNAGATVALNLGWQLTEIAYHGEPCAGRKPPDRPDLPTLSDLHRWEITGIGVNTVEADIHRLASSWADAGLEAPSAEPVKDAFFGGTETDLKQASEALHYQLLGLLHAADFTLGEAYDLGRALAYTTLKPHDGPTLKEQFRSFRLETLQGWLADLATALPVHAARSVAISLDLWQRVIPDPAAASDAAGTVASESLASSASTPASSAAQGSPAIPSRLRLLIHRQASSGARS